jgi:RNA-binding protein Musashi
MTALVVCQVLQPDLHAYFAVFGPVSDAMVAMDFATQQPRGFGFVTMATKEGFDLVMASQSHEIFGKWMDLKPAVDREVMKSRAEAPMSHGGAFDSAGALDSYKGGTAQV